MATNKRTPQYRIGVAGVFGKVLSNMSGRFWHDETTRCTVCCNSNIKMLVLNGSHRLLWLCEGCYIAPIYFAGARSC